MRFTFVLCLMLMRSALASPCSNALNLFASSPSAYLQLERVSPSDLEVFHTLLPRSQRATKEQFRSVTELSAEDWKSLLSVPGWSREEWLRLLLTDESPRELSNFVRQVPAFVEFAERSQWPLKESLSAFSRVAYHSGVDDLKNFLPEVARSYEQPALDFLNRWAKGFSHFPLQEVHQTRDVFIDGVRGLDLKPWQALHMAAGISRDLTPLQFLERIGKLDLHVQRVFQNVDAEIKTIQGGWTPWGAIRRMAALAGDLKNPRSALSAAAKDRRLLNQRFLPIFTALYSVDMTWTLVSDFGVRFAQGGMDQYLNEFGIVAMNFFTFAMCDAVLGFLSATRSSTKMARQAIQDQILDQSVYLARGYNTPEFVRRGLTLGAAGFGFATVSGVGVESYRYFVLESDQDHREPLGDRYLRVLWNATYTAAFMGVWSNLRYNLIFDRLGPWLEKSFFRNAPVRFNSTMTAVGVTNSGIGATTYVLGQGQVSDPLYNAFLGVREELGVSKATEPANGGQESDPLWNQSLDDLEAAGR